MPTRYAHVRKPFLGCGFSRVGKKNEDAINDLRRDYFRRRLLRRQANLYGRRGGGNVQETGRPILALAERNRDRCAAPMHELNTNASIKPLTVQFVPLKVITEGVTWGSWARKYPPKGRHFLLYDDLADGKMLYGESGFKLGNEILAQFMAQYLRQAGRLLNDREVELLQSTVAAAKEHLEKGEKTEAVRQIARLSKLGTVGDLQSYSRIAVEADGLAKQLIDQGVEQIDEAASKLEAPETQLEAHSPWLRQKLPMPASIKSAAK